MTLHSLATINAKNYLLFDNGQVVQPLFKQKIYVLSFYCGEVRGVHTKHPLLFTWSQQFVHNKLQTTKFFFVQVLDSFSLLSMEQCTAYSKVHYNTTSEQVSVQIPDWNNNIQ